MIFEKCVSCSNGVVLYGFVVLEKYTRIKSKPTAGNFLNRLLNVFLVTLVKVFKKRWRGFALFGESG